MLQQHRLSWTRLVVQLIYGRIQTRCGTWCWLSSSLPFFHSVANAESRSANCSSLFLKHQVIQKFHTILYSLFPCHYVPHSTTTHRLQSLEEVFPSTHNIPNLRSYSLNGESVPNEFLETTSRSKSLIKRSSSKSLGMISQPRPPGTASHTIYRCHTRRRGCWVPCYGSAHVRTAGL